MRGYGQFCPIAKASEFLGERWTILVLRELAAGSETFNDLRRGLPLISPSLLSTRLKTLEYKGVVKRDEYAGGGTRYQLTGSGQELMPIIWQLGAWGHKWVRSELADGDLDPSMLMWDIHRTMNVDYFDPLERHTVLVELTNYTSSKRLWWFVIYERDVDVCLKDPGYEVQLKISTELRTLTAIWMGDAKMALETKAGRVQITGDSRLKRDISKWLGTNFYADVKPAFRGQLQR